MKIYIANDHAGLEMKNAISTYLKTKYEIVNLGTNTKDSVDYPDYAFKLGEIVAKDKDSIGILICGTGFGMCLAVNKVKGIRAVNLVDVNTAPLAKQHNNANVICLSARFSSFENNQAIIEAFMDAQFETRHQQRLDKVTKYEREHG
ncbi:MAG: ribose 5-phosphate isomerase B [Mycoplasmataceae bacterium]|jgi:ribose 5-phosphate isomerase B|nr:ribose 5-phosphate isomerase B [Mycoplasmataceae bacterium]